MDQQSGREWISKVDVLCRVYLFNGVVRIYEQGNKTLINCVGRSVQEYIVIVKFDILQCSYSGLLHVSKLHKFWILKHSALEDISPGAKLWKLLRFDFCCAPL